MAEIDTKFPCSIVIDLPLPSQRLASAALQALQVDEELSPLVNRTFSLGNAEEAATNGTNGDLGRENDKCILRTEYKATTNRMLRVAVNGFMESLSVVLGVMEELDIDVLSTER